MQEARKGRLHRGLCCLSAALVSSKCFFTDYRQLKLLKLVFLDHLVIQQLYLKVYKNPHKNLCFI